MRVRKSLAWSFSQEFVQKAVQFLGSIVIARLLTPDEVGIFSIAMAANFLMSSLREFGAGTYLIREPELTQDKIRTVFGLVLTVHWTLGVLVLLARQPLAELYSEPGIAEVLTVVAATFFIGPFGQPATALMRREMRFDQLHHISAAGVVMGTGTSLIFAALGFSYMSMAWGLLVGNVVRVILTLSVRREHLRLRPGLRHWREVLQFGGWLTGAGLAGTLSAEGIKFIIGGLLTPGSVALFERAQQLPSVSRQILFAPVGRVLVPAFSQDIRDGKSIGPKVQTYVAATTVILWPAYLTLSFVSVPVVVLLFGENWQFAGEILPYLLAGTAIRAALPQPEEILVPHGLVRRLFVFRCCQVLNMVAFTVTGALHSLELCAILQVPASIVYLGGNAAAILPYMEASYRTLAASYLHAGLIAFICALPTLFVTHIYQGTPHLSVLLLAVGCGGLLWLGAIQLSQHSLAKEVSNLLPAIRRFR